MKRLPVKEIVVDLPEDCNFRFCASGCAYCGLLPGSYCEEYVPDYCPLRTANYLIKLGGKDENNN